ncbi:MAG TPA: T9SS type A sorting domain-containing protein, partial [Bacteroidales bacterium]|nr:T9SS type A sorting domain-containing protein [Bacteroidales bacterium]
SGFTGRPEYTANIGSSLPEGNYDYAARFQLGSGDFVYGGYSSEGGGFWNGTANVSGLLTVSNTGPVPSIGWANLQGPASGVIAPAQPFSVFGQVWIENTTGSGTATAGLLAWVGYSADNTNPNSWTSWVPASYNGAVGNNDRFTAEIGSLINTPGTYYYATRYQYLDQPFVYGGLNGPWDAETSPSGVLSVTTTPPVPEITFANLQWPPTASILVGGSVTVYAQIQATGVNLGTNGYEGLSAWIGYGATGTAPSTWTNWVSAAYNGVSGFTGRPEYTANIGSSLPEGNYDYAARFQLGSGDFVYGGYSSEGGGFWNGTANVSGLLTVSNTGPVPSIGWANLQGPASGVIAPAQPFSVFGQVWIENTTGSGTATAGLQAWVGYSADNTNPNSWTSWVPASYNGAVGNNDRFTAEIGSLINTPGTYYYATRYQYLDQPFVYGGLNGPWDAETSPSGVLSVTTTPPVPEITFANLQWPPTASILVGGSVTVYAQIQATGVNLGTNGYEGLSAWIGYGATGTAPSSWTNWVSAAYNGVSGFTGRPEYTANIGSTLPAGNYDYASRFQLPGQPFVYGGYADSGGGFWNGTTNVSGVLTVNSTPPEPVIGWANLQWPGSAQIQLGDPLDVYAQVWIENITGQGNATPGLQAWIGFSTTNTDPSTWTSWVPANFNVAVGNNDEFSTNLGNWLPGAGTYYYTSRFRYLSQPYVYGGFSPDGGGFWNGTSNVSGVVTVTGQAASYPVLFTVTDLTGLYENIKLKGSMTNWQPVPMIRSGNIWTLTLQLQPGVYEWGVLEDDGSPDGLWLVQGPNLVMAIDLNGNISGTTTYFITYVGLPEKDVQARIYPNPNNGRFTLEILQPESISACWITDITGNRVLEQKLVEKVMHFDLSPLHSGVYLLFLQKGRELHVYKIIKVQ